MGKMNLKGYDPEITATIKQLKSKEINKETRKEESSAPIPPTCAFTFKGSYDVIAALRRAATDRKLLRQSPATQQEIAELAIRSWLTERGYME